MKNQIIQIENPDDYPIDTKLLSACLARSASLLTGETTIRIEIDERTRMDAPEHRNPGMLVYKMRIRGNGSTKCIECVSRKPHLSVEFHE